MNENIIEDCACGREHPIDEYICVEHKRHIPCRSCNREESDD